MAGATAAVLSFALAFAYLIAAGNMQFRERVGRHIDTLVGLAGTGILIWACKHTFGRPRVLRPVFLVVVGILLVLLLVVLMILPLE